MTYNKQIIFIGICIAFILVGLQLYKDSSDWVGQDYTAKNVEIFDSSIVGYDKGKRSYEIHFDYSWAGRNKYIFRIRKITLGRLYDKNGKMVLDNIEAERVRVNSRSKVIIATKNAQAVFVKRDKGKSDFSVSSTSLKYFNYNKKAYLGDGVYLKGEDVEVSANEMILDANENILTIKPPFQIILEDYYAKSGEMEVNIDKEVTVLKGGVSVSRDAQTGNFDDISEREAQIRQKPALLTAGRLEYKALPNKNAEITLSNTLKLTQPDKEIEAEKGTYLKTEKEFTAEGYVRFYADNLAWIVKKEKRDQFKNDEIQESLYKPVELKTDWLWVNTEKGILKLKGNVYVKQGNRVITCDNLDYDDESGLIVLQGNVTIEKGEGEVLSGDKIVIDVNNEQFWTESKTAIEFEID